MEPCSSLIWAQRELNSRFDELRAPLDARPINSNRFAIDKKLDGESLNLGGGGGPGGRAQTRVGATTAASSSDVLSSIAKSYNTVSTAEKDSAELITSKMYEDRETWKFMFSL